MFYTTMSTFAPTTASSQSNQDITSELKVKVISNKNELQVFLGGSCNPTTWRQNLAIPYLEMNGISYYNPQIDNWTPEVVELEHRAKQDAQVLLFVIDDQTRATVTLIESAFLAGEDKNIVFVFYPFESNMICGSEQSLKAYNLHGTHKKMMKASLTKTQNCISLSCTSSSESSSSSTMSSTRLISKTSDTPTLKSASVYRKTSNASSTKSETGDEKEGTMDLHNRQELTRLARCSLRLAGESISVEEFRELKQARSILKNLIDMRKIPIFTDIPQALNYISCQIRDSIPHRKAESNSWCDEELLCLRDTRLRQNLTESNKNFTGHNDELQIKDVYLSIDSDDCTILDTTVIPMLEASGLSYSYMSMKNIANSQKSIDDSSSDCALRIGADQKDGEAGCKDQALKLLSDQTINKAKVAIEQELYAIRTSKVLLFVITNKCRGLSIMVLASHFMALLRNNVVLCVQYLEDPCTIEGEKLSKNAIADYNRGRVYLCDDAVKSRVPVFSTISEAIECCSMKCQHIK